MRHNQIQKQLSAYLDNELSLREKAQVEIHLRACDACAKILADLKRNSEWFASLRQPASSGIWEAVQEKIADANPGAVKQRLMLDFSEFLRQWFSRPVTAGVGALVTLGLVLAFIYLNLPSQPAEDPLDFYLMAHTGYTTHNPLRFQGVNPFVATANPDAQSADAITEDSQTPLDSYLDAYFGE
jgi:hypothetical protein